MADKINIGKLIKAKLRERKMSVVEFGNALNCCRNNVYKIFDSDDIEINRLIKISKILDYDFLLLYTQQIHDKKRFIVEIIGDNIKIVKEESSENHEQ
jgi:predicted transcriptional regulator